MNGLLEWSTGLTFFPLKITVYGQKTVIVIATHSPAPRTTASVLYQSRLKVLAWIACYPSHLGGGRSWVRGYSIDNRKVQHINRNEACPELLLRTNPQNRFLLTVPLTFFIIMKSMYHPLIAGAASK